MERLISAREMENWQTEVASDALIEAQYAALEDVRMLLQNVPYRLPSVSYYDSSSRVAGYQQALLDAMVIIKKRVSITGYLNGKK